MALGIQVVRRSTDRVVSEFEAPEAVPLETVIEVLEAEHSDVEVIVARLEDTDDTDETRGRGWFEEGEVVIDRNPPHWSTEPAKVIVKNITNMTAAEYYLGSLGGKTVATENPAYPETDTVIEGQYLKQAGGQEYAFPASRLKPEES